jgi:hypothetical protein
MALSPSLLIACVLCATAAAQPQPGRDPFPGNALVATGKVLAYGGLGLAIFGYYSTPRFAGLAAFGIGVPLVGLGGREWNRAAEAVDSGYHANVRGWGWNLTGMGLIAAGAAGLAQGSSGSSGAVYGGALLLETGLVCELVALVKFSRYAGEGRAVLAKDGIAIEPLWLNPQGPTAPGLRITYRL